MEVIFPHCWDGVNLESVDQSHVTYTPMCDEEFTCFHWPCPASHPVKIPEINLFLEIYDYEGGAHTFADGTDVSSVLHIFSKIYYILSSCSTVTSSQDGMKNSCRKFSTIVTTPQIFLLVLSSVLTGSLARSLSLMVLVWR